MRVSVSQDSLINLMIAIMIDGSEKQLLRFTTRCSTTSQAKRAFGKLLFEKDENIDYADLGQRANLKRLSQ